ncbi:MAG: DUF3536 domain-containing protein [Brevinematales bacterium]|nr:DUF3536 domain-containing protein [Brevinematales bacterium]
MDRFHLIIHGHFYQPPREDPATLEIENQPSAFPFSNWNEKINRECYAANAASRVLDSAGRIIDIINNYEFISFNFGPTLLQWIKKYDYQTYKRIIDADIKSRNKNNGHGNAIAQVYNHIILPLACDEDIITQIEWGLKAFEMDFGRNAEGIWLSETAINDKVAEYLIRYGIKFVILSPFQVEEVYYQDRKEWVNVSDGSIDYSRPYILEESNGKLAVFFYYPELASKVSFEHLLRNVDFLKGEILKHKDKRLVHYATDGEIYGHHEPFGDMCLSRLIYENRKREEFIFTNYANYLEQYPPVDIVRLKKGNDGLGTSWSCAHGVDRWRKDCGCSTGGKDGWNQKWRVYLRDAFDYLRNHLFEKAKEFLGEYIYDVWNARNDYITVFYSLDYNEREKRTKEFLKKHLKKSISKDTEVLILKYFEALYYEMLMYTSCGWFFADISGIEPIQDLRYANQLILLMKDIFDEKIINEFKNILSKAKSNIEEYDNGKKIFEDFVEKPYFSTEKMVFEFILKNGNKKDEFYYFYKNKIIDQKIVSKNDYEVTLYIVETKNVLIEEIKKVICLLLKIDNKYYGFVKKYIDDYFFKYLEKIIKNSKKNILLDIKEFLGDYFTLKDIQPHSRKEILKRLFNEKMQKLHKFIQFSSNELNSYLDVIDLYGELGITIPEFDRIAIRELLNSFVLKELENIGTDNYDFSMFIKAITVAKKANLKLDYTDILPVIRNFVISNMTLAIEELNISAIKKLIKVIDITNISGIEFEKYEIQNLIFEKIKNLDKKLINKEEVKLLFELARKFNIGVEEI